MRFEATTTERSRRDCPTCAGGDEGWNFPEMARR
jgi:hypothetical protein